MKKLLTPILSEPQSVSIPGKGTYWGNWIVIKGQQTLIANETAVAWRNWRCDQGETFRTYLQLSVDILLLTCLQRPQHLMKVVLRILRLFLLRLGRKPAWMLLRSLFSMKLETIRGLERGVEKVNSFSIVEVFTFLCLYIT